MKSKKNTLLFVLPFFDNIGDYVRAKCLKNYCPTNWEYIYLKGKYPKFLNFLLIRYIYRFFFYLFNVFVFCFHKKNSLAYFIIPQNPLLIFIISKIMKIKVISDITDAQHLDVFLGYKKTKSIMDYSDAVIFESNEYQEFWANKIKTSTYVCEDTAQHECIYLDFNKRKKKLIWVGSFHTSNYLFNYIDYFKLFKNAGYKICILGATKFLSEELNKKGVPHISIYDYDRNFMIKEILSSKISFIPMENSELFNFRGSLKAKISMAYGALVIASDNKQHRRIIENKKNGFLFNTKEDLNKIINLIESDNVASKIAIEGNKTVANNYTMQAHSNKLIDVASKLIS